MRSVRLYGELERLVGTDELALTVTSPAEAIRAITKQVPGARYLIVRSHWRIVEGERDLDLHELSYHRPDGPTIHIVPALEGAGDEAGPLKILAGFLFIGIGLIAGAGLFGGFIGGASKFIIGIGAATALGGLARLISPTPTVDPMIPEAAEDRQSYLFSGNTNLQGDGHPIPLVYGRTRTGSVVISQRFEAMRDYTAFDLESITKLKAVDLISEGEVEGFVKSGLQSVFFDDTAVEEANGGFNFPSVVAKLVVGDGANPVLTGGVENVFGVAVSATNADGTPTGAAAGAVIRTISDPDVTHCRLTIGMAALYTVNATTGALESATVNWDIDVSSNGGPWQQAQAGLGPGNTIALGTPTDPLPRAFGPTVRSDVGGWDFVPQMIFTSDPGSTVSIELRWRSAGSADPWQSRSMESPTQFVPGEGFFPDTWRSAPGFAEVFRGLPADQYEFELHTAETATFFSAAGLLTERVPDGLFTGRALSPYEEDFLIDDLSQYGPAPWSIRFSRADIDSADPAARRDEILWQRYAEVIDRDFDYPDHARVEIELPAAATGGQIPTRLYELDGLKVRVPDNLTTATRVYTGIWSGTFAVAAVWYDNPAWVLLDLLTNPRYGLGRADSEIDLWSFYDAAVWCDAFVASADGGTEPRATFNHTYSTLEGYERVIALCLASMQARLWDGNGKIFLTVDKPEPGPPARLFTNANVIDGVFEYSELGRSARLTVASSQWRNPANAYKAENLSADRPHGIDRYGERETAVVAVGATTEGQARRRARYELLTNELEGLSVKFRVSDQDVFAEPGEIAEVQDANREEMRGGGRVRTWAPSTPSVTLDKGIKYDSGSTYTLRVMLDDGTVHETTTVPDGGGGGPDTLWENWFVNSPAIPGGRTILPNAVWTVSANPPKWFRLAGIAEVGEGKYEISAYQHEPTKQAQIEDFDDWGSAYVIPLPASLLAPTIDSLSMSFDAATDVWSVVIAWTHDDPDEAYWAHVRAQILVPAIIQDRTTSDGTITIPIGDHDLVNGLDVLVAVSSATRDGASESPLANDQITISSVRP